MKIREIQALRALAAGLVLLYHARVIDGGYLGVDIFYVISGFLITGLIVKEVRNTGSLNLKAFYLRRAKRLLPASFLVLIATALISWWVMPVTARHDLGKHIAGAALYISNFLFAFWGNDYQNLNAVPPVVVHYWSLAVEEQFYLFWPLLIFFIMKRFGERTLFYSISAITLLSFFYSLYLTSASPVWAFYILPTRAWELGVGALLLYLPKSLFQSRAIALASFLLLTYCSLTFNDLTPFPGTAALAPVLATGYLIGGIAVWPGFIRWVGNWRMSQWLGAISYPLYLWHWPALVLPAIYLGTSLTWWQRLLCIALTVLLADLTHRYIEEPLRHRTISSKTVGKVALAATTMSVLLGAGIYATYSEIIHVKGSSLVFRMSDVMQKPVVYADGCHSGYGESVPDQCAYGDLTSQKTIVLYGDSHAAQWFPALEQIARAKGLKLVSFTKSACPAAEVKRASEGGFKESNCLTWRRLTLEEIRKLKPAAVIMSSYQHYKLPSGYSSDSQWLREGQSSLAKKLENVGASLIYISDTPLPKRDIPSCLASRKIEQCQALPSKVIVDPAFKTINPTPWLCSPSCPSVRDNEVMYRDDSHISVAAAKSLAPRLEEALAALGAL